MFCNVFCLTYDHATPYRRCQMPWLSLPIFDMHPIVHECFIEQQIVKRWKGMENIKISYYAVGYAIHLTETLWCIAIVN